MVEHTWMREDGLRVDRMLLVTDTNYIPSGMGPAESVSQMITETVPGGLGTVSIAYQYDARYRLAGASYTGAITATYAYVYDAVGNMTAFTETVGVETTRVTRSFDAANRLQTAFDYDAGTTSYYYDDNGNLMEILPPGATGQNPVGGLRYAYDQRNLLITHTTYVSGTGWVLQAEYIYDGAGDRLQQVDHTGVTPVTTTYSNDVFGLTQVLVADDGTAQVYNLFGLDLISQDSGGEVRTLLADGLGSVRLEMVGGMVDTATTYEPYGQVLAQVGTSGTVYGFTGEQEDAATGLLYLRARYYSVELKTFMGRDQWEGNGKRPGTLNYYIYVENNPTNYTDPSGLLACEAPQAGCSQWVRYALNKIESVPLAVGKELVQNLWSEDRRIQYIQSVLEAGTYMNDNCSTLLPPHTPGFRIIFTDNMPWPSSDNFGMVTRPWAIFIKTSKFNPPNPPRGADILLLAHELVHLEQGPHFAMSVLGEVLAYQIEGDLRNYIAPGSTPSNAENSAAAIDLADPAILFNYRRWEQMWSDLVGWQNSNTNYANVPFILPPLGNPFPPPVGAGYPY